MTRHLKHLEFLADADSDLGERILKTPGAEVHKIRSKLLPASYTQEFFRQEEKIRAMHNVKLKLGIYRGSPRAFTTTVNGFPAGFLDWFITSVLGKPKPITEQQYKNRAKTRYFNARMPEIWSKVVSNLKNIRRVN